MQKHMSSGVQNIIDIVWELRFKVLECQLSSTIFYAEAGIVLSGFTNLASYNCLVVFFCVNEVGESHMDTLFSFATHLFFQVYVLFLCLHEMILMWLLCFVLLTLFCKPLML
jgi:hypothetical protein